MADQGIYSQTVTLTFPPDLANNPVIYNMGKLFHVRTDIRRANLSQNHGYVVLAVSGPEEAVTQSLEWVKEQGVRVEPTGEIQKEPQITSPIFPDLQGIKHELYKR